MVNLSETMASDEARMSDQKCICSIRAMNTLGANSKCDITTSTSPLVFIASHICAGQIFTVLLSENNPVTEKFCAPMERVLALTITYLSQMMKGMWVTYYLD